jgi:hypothetical protein
MVLYIIIAALPYNYTLTYTMNVKVTKWFCFISIQKSIHKTTHSRREIRSLALPDSASVIFRSRDDGVSLVIEGTAENLVSVAHKYLEAITRFGLPDAGGLI